MTDINKELDRILDNNAIELIDYFNGLTGQEGKVTQVKPGAKAKLLALIHEEVRKGRVDELERLIGSGIMGDKYRSKAKHGFTTVQERLAQLNKEEGNDDQ